MEKLENSDVPIGMFQRQACYTFVVQYNRTSREKVKGGGKSQGINTEK